MGSPPALFEGDARLQSARARHGAGESLMNVLQPIGRRHQIIHLDEAVADQVERLLELAQALRAWCP